MNQRTHELGNPLDYEPGNLTRDRELIQAVRGRGGVDGAPDERLAGCRELWRVSWVGFGGRREWKMHPTLEEARDHADHLENLNRDRKYGRVEWIFLDRFVVEEVA